LVKDGAGAESVLGQTEWSKSGRWTGKTDIPLTEAGRKQVASSAQVLVGPSKLIDPQRLARVYISPRRRAVETFDLMFSDPTVNNNLIDSRKAIETDELAEWDYGDYEGLKTHEIRAFREQRGLDGHGWDHFRDGCEGGEYGSYCLLRTNVLTCFKDPRSK